jgi:hypothetical protein
MKQLQLTEYRNQKEFAPVDEYEIDTDDLTSPFEHYNFKLLSEELTVK